MHLFRLALLILTLMPLSMQSMASELISPLPVRNLYPPMMRFYDPVPDSALRAYEESWMLEVNQYYSTVNIVDQRQASQLMVDMELGVFEPVIRRSIGRDLELSIRVPLLMPSSGILDDSIQSFHGWFNMPDGGRALRPNNRFAYSFDNGTGSTWRGRNRWELGNVELSGRYNLVSHKHWAVAALAAAKLPTASKARGWGSGAADLAGGMVASWSQNDFFAHVEGWLVHPLAKEEPGIRYVSYQRGSITGGYQMSDGLSFLIQAQGGNSPYNSSIATLDHPPFLISAGMRGRLDKDVNWVISVTENISQKTTQDISLHAGFSVHLK